MNNNLINSKDLNSSLFEGYDQSTDGIGILVEMAKSGKIDPWNIDIVDVTEKYLQKMIEMKSLNLKVASRTLLFAAILCRMQSNVLAGLSLDEFKEEEPEVIYDEDGFIAEYSDEDEPFVPTSNVVKWDEALQRRTSIRLNRNRVVTLKDLIKQLEFYEILEKRASLKSAHERAKRHVREQIFAHNDRIELNDLMPLGLDKISEYMALLFICRDTDYELEQEEFYSDLYVVKGGSHATA